MRRPDAGQAAAAVDRPRRAEGGPAGARAATASRAAFVAMDPRNGEVLGLGSNPSFDPNVFAKGVKASVYKQLTDADNGAPLANRAIQGLYPTGSTFKLITATAALEGGLITPAQRAVRRRFADRRRRHVQERRRRLLRRARAAARAAGVLGRLLLPARPGGRPARRQPDPEVGAPARPRPADRHRPPGRGGRARPDARHGATACSARS